MAARRPRAPRRMLLLLPLLLAAFASRSTLICLADDTAHEQFFASVHLLQREPRFRRVVIETSLPPGGAWALGHVGDFDGDGTSDYLSVSNPPTRIWILWGAKNLGRSPTHSAETMYFTPGQTLTENQLTSGDFTGRGKEGVLIGFREDPARDLLLLEIDRNAGSFTLTPIARPAGGYAPVTSHSIRDTGKKAQIGIQRHNQADKYEIYRVAGNRLELVESSQPPIPAFALLGASPSDGDGTADLLLANQQVFVVRRGDPAVIRPWLADGALSELPFTAGVRFNYHEWGDFNGDGAVDFIVRRPGILGWHFFAGSEAGGIPQPISPVFSEPIEEFDIAVGDFNGDGRDDLLRRVWRANDRFDVLLSEPGAPLADVEMLLDGSELARSDASGRFRLSANAPAIAPSDFSRLKLNKAGYIFAAAPPLSSGANKIPLRFLAAAATGRGGLIGRAVEAGIGFSEQLPGPFTCTGFNPGSESQWGSIVEGECSAGYGVFAVNELVADSSDSRSREVTVRCCRLPRPDILLADTSIAHDRCPEDSVVVGVRNYWAEPQKARELLCRRVNRAKYKLSPPETGVYYGEDASARRHTVSKRFNDLPLALRPGLGRIAENRRHHSICAGAEPGALFSGGRGIACQNFQFRRLLDARTGEEVKMYPPCRAIADPFSAYGGCVPGPGEK